MSSTLRRRHNLVDPADQACDSPHYEGLDEPLLSGDRDMGETWDERKNEAHLHWTLNFTQLIAQWAQWLGSFLGRFFPLSFANPNSTLDVPTLSPLQEERLRDLRERLGVPFDGSLEEHQEALKHLWKLAFPSRELPSLKSVLWKEMGWQGSDPSTDFRGGGFISLQNLIFFAENYPSSFQKLLHKKEGNRVEWEYPFAVAGINVSFMLTQMLDLHAGKPSNLAGIRFLELLGDDAMAFDVLFCVAFEVMDAQWLAKRATYMEFNDVLRSTRAQLERELSLEDVFSVRDLPAFGLLIK